MCRFRVQPRSEAFGAGGAVDGAPRRHNPLLGHAWCGVIAPACQRTAVPACEPGLGDPVRSCSMCPHSAQAREVYAGSTCATATPARRASARGLRAQAHVDSTSPYSVGAGRLRVSPRAQPLLTQAAASLQARAPVERPFLVPSYLAASAGRDPRSSRSTSRARVSWVSPQLSAATTGMRSPGRRCWGSFKNQVEIPVEDPGGMPRARVTARSRRKRMERAHASSCPEHPSVARAPPTTGR